MEFLPTKRWKIRVLRRGLRTSLVFLLLTQLVFGNLTPFLFPVFASTFAEATVDKQEPIPTNLPKPFNGDYPVTRNFGEIATPGVLGSATASDSAVLAKIAELEGEAGHRGIDFTMPEGTEVLAVDEGRVKLASEDDYGLTVVIEHAWGESVYGHLSEIRNPNIEILNNPEIQNSNDQNTLVGQKVSKGEVIAISGSSGIVTGPHLHLGLKNSLGEWMNPANYLPTELTSEVLPPLEATTSATLSASTSANLQAQVLGEATPSASLTIPKMENIATDSAYLFNYKFNLINGTSAHFDSKYDSRPGFAIADENYDYKLRFFLKEATNSAQPKVESNQIEFPVIVPASPDASQGGQGIPMTLRYTVSQDRVKEEIVIEKNPFEATEVKDLSIPFEVQTVGLTRQKQDNQDIFISQASSPPVYWTVPAPTVKDAEGKSGQISGVLEENSYNLILDIEYLKQAVYPVTIDPTVVIGSAGCNLNIANVSADANESYNYKAVCPGMEARFNDKTNKTVGFRIKQPSSGQEVEFKLQGFTNKTPTIAGNQVSYNLTISGISTTLRFTVLDNEAKEEFIINTKPPNIILNSLPATLNLSFDLAKVGITPVQDADGTVHLNDATSGEEIFTIPKLTYTDATGATGAISLAIADTTATISIDTNFLKTATYPVTIDPTVVVGTSSTTGATQPSTMRHIVRTSEATLHSFIQMGTDTTKCGSGGLWWLYSTDSGTTWTCGGQLSSDTTNLMYADARADTSDNIYVVYSVATWGGSTAYDVFYRKLTKGAGSTWTLESSQTVIDSTASTTGAHYATLELQGTTRAWLAFRYYDGTNYQVRVYYSDSLGTAPTWTVSQATLDTAGTSSTYHIPTITRFGSNIGVIYYDQPTFVLKWRYRADSDGLTSWVAESTAMNQSFASVFSAVGDTSGNVYLAANYSSGIYFNYWNGTVWSSTATVSSAAASSAFTSIATDGTNAWVFYGETTGLSGSLSGSRKLVYKKGVPPFTSSDFDTNSTAVVSQHGTFDKYWSYVSAVYTDDTTDAGNTTSADTQMVTGVGDIAYFGKTATFDAISWDVSTSGVGGVVAWEYCNAVDATPACTSWATLSLNNQPAPNFTSDSWIAFTAPADWQAAKVNAEGTAYYYIRARVTTLYTTTPVGVQMAAIPQINWAGVTGTVASNTTHLVWTENAASPTRVRYSSVTTTASAAPSSTANISPVVPAYSSTTAATQPSTMRHIVRTSEGTLHAFVQASTFSLPSQCSGNTGLNWIYSTDSGTTWTCQGQLSSDTTNLMYADARADSSDNIYVVYSVAATAGSTAHDVFYRKLTKGAGSTWTLEAAQTVLDGDGSGDNAGFHYATIELQGTTRAWIAAREYDGTNYQVGVYYSDGLTAAPTWTVSQATLDTAGTNSTYHIPTMTRFGSNIGVIYYDQTTSVLKWRYRADSDGLTSWVAESTAMNQSFASVFSAVGDTSGNVYLAANYSSGIYFNYWNGTVWSSTVTVSSAVLSGTSTSVATDGTNAWVFYGEITGLSGSLSGNRKLVYKKGVPPFTSSDFDTNSTAVVSQHGTFDKYWSFVSSVYTDDTTDAGNTTSADTQMVTGVGDIAYFGKTAKFDAISWDVSTLGVGGAVTWEYWNGTTWMQLTDFLAFSANNLTADGYITFIPHTDWATTTVNAEGTSYYYVRARVTTAYTTSPVGVQMAAIPQINWAGATSNVVSNTTHLVWTENAASPMRVRYASVTTTASTAPTSTANISPVVPAYSSTTAATQPSTMRHIVRTSDGTLHAFVQLSTFNNGTQCSGNTGLNWIYSTDSGSTWTCGGQLSSDTTYLMYADARADTSDNIYVVYSVATSGGSTAYDVFYRKLTKGAGSTWTLEAQQTALDSTASTTGYHYATLELQGTTRLWLAFRYYDGTNYQVRVYYSDGLTAAPTWTVSQATLDTAGNSSNYHYPTMARFGSNIGVIYYDQTTSVLKWRYRADSDGLTSWATESTAMNQSFASVFSAVGDTSGNVYLTANYSSGIYFNYWNGTVWSSTATVSSAAASSAFASVATDGTNAWVFYGETTGLSGGLSGSRKLVYKKCVPPFTASDCDATATSVVSYHGTFDKYWSYVSSAYTDDTTDAGNTTTADTQMVTGVGDIAYFGKTAKFDSISWDVSTSGVGGDVVWEYWNGSSWTTITDWLAFSADNFTADGYLSFIPHTDWATTQINAEGTAYYYIRARVTTAYTTSPIGVQMAAIPQINWAGATSNVVSNTTHLVWTENAASPTRVRYSSVTTTASAAPSSTANISPVVPAYSSTTAATQPSTMRHIVRTSEGTLHAFVQAGTTLACGGATGSNNLGLNWIYSTDSGTTWTCQGQLSSDTTNLMYADARADSSDNIYVVYSVAATAGSTAHDVFYRKLTKGAGSTWTLEAAQTVLDGDGSGDNAGFHYATIELQGTTRAWIAAREYDGTNYQVGVYYSDGLTTAPTWTQSVAALDTARNDSFYHMPTTVRFGSKIGVIYNDQGAAGDRTFRWRYRSDGDSLTSWVAEATVSDPSDNGSAKFSAVGDTSGNVYLASRETFSGVVNFTYFNSTSWSSLATVTNSNITGGEVALSTDGTSVWVFYGETTGLSGSLSGSRKLVYKKGVSPFATGNFDTNSTAVVSYHGTFDKYWSYVSAAYTDDTTDAGNITTADTQMVTGVGDIAYFGKTAKFDAISWDVSTSGVGGVVAWEYWNGTTWMVLTDFLAFSTQNFTADGYMSFIPHTDWATTTVNAEGTAYYYIRARTTTAYTTSPVGVQMATIPQINWANVAASTAGRYFIWTENAASPTRIRFSSFTSNTAPSAPSSLGPAGLVDGSWTTDNTPTPTFTLSDPDAADTVKYQIQIDDTSDFSSAVVDYTSALAAQGATSFTVGQAAGSGSYTTGTAGQTLSDGSYYWRVKAIDNSAAASAYSTANSGAIAFKVDTTAPTVPGTPSTTTPTSDNTPTWTWTASTDSGSGLHATTPYSVQWCTDSLFTGCAANTSTLTTSSFTHSTSLVDGTWYFRAKAKDAVSNESNYSSNGSVLIDTTAPTLSSISASVTSTGSTITWTTNENSSSKVDFGLTNTYGSTTSETDTSPRVTNHSVTITNLVACTTYHYRVRSKDAATNEVIDSDRTFSTSGCVGSATVNNQTSSTITTTSGGTVNLLSNNTGVTLTIPSSFAASNADFQIKQMDKTAIINTTSTPTGFGAIGSYIYDFRALSGVDTAISSFNSALTVSVAYTVADVSGVDEGTLGIYRYDGTWSELSGCSVNTSTKTVSCTTSAFSIFGLFGRSSSTSSTSSSTTSTTSAGGCGDAAPGNKAPWLYGAIPEGSTAIRLYFTEAADPVDKYVLQFGTKAGEYQYGATNIGGKGLRTYLVQDLQPNTTYYFRVRGGNGCATGPWSNELSGRTGEIFELPSLLEKIIEETKEIINPLTGKPLSLPEVAAKIPKVGLPDVKDQLSELVNLGVQPLLAARDIANRQLSIFGSRTASIAFGIAQQWSNVNNQLIAVLEGYNQTTDRVVRALGQTVRNTSETMGEQGAALAGGISKQVAATGDYLGRQVGNRLAQVTSNVNESVKNIKNQLADIGQSVSQSAETVIGGARSAVKIVSSRAEIAVALEEVNTLAQTVNLASETVGNQLTDNVRRVTKQTKNNLEQQTQNVGRQIADTKQSISWTMADAAGEVTYRVTTAYSILTGRGPNEISGVSVANNSPTSVTIYWHSKHKSTSKVNYGFDTSWGLGKQDSRYVNDHYITLENLESGKQYFFEVMSQNGGYVYDAYYTFTTGK